MSGIGNSPSHIAFEFKDLEAEFFSVSCHGQMVLLGGLKSLALVNLDKPSEVAANVRRNLSEINAVQWNPHASHSSHFLVANQNSAELWILDPSCTLHQPIETVKAHGQNITDVDWCLHDPALGATCSLDGRASVWDIRDFQKPVLTLKSIVGAYNVKWSRSNPNLIATSHDGDLRIWDPRKGSSAVHYLTGHTSRITGIDWSPFSDGRFATCSRDCSVKLWDIGQPKQLEDKLRLPSPVWRVKYTPFGRGLVTSDRPQPPAGDCTLLLWGLASVTNSNSGNSNVAFDQRMPSQAFTGFTDIVLDIQWRHMDSDMYEIMALSRDRLLHMWPFDPYLRQLCEEACELNVDTVSMDKSLTMDMPLVCEPPFSVRNLDLTCLGGIMTMSSELPSSSCLTNVNVRSTAGIMTIAGKTLPSSGGDVMSGSREFTMTSAATTIPRPPVASQQHQKSLDQEFVLLNLDIPNVTVFDMDPEQRVCKVTATYGTFEVHLTMHFPDEYPNNAAPSFVLTNETNVDDSAQSKLIKVLHNTALQHVKHNRSCIEPCLRQLVSCLESLKQDDSLHGSPDTPPYFTAFSRKSSVIRTPSFLSTYSIELLRNESVPFPRTSGARFCGGGYLVCFTRRIIEVHRDKLHRTPSATDLTPTPRAMSALSALTQSSRASQLAPSASVAYCNYNVNVMARSLPSDSNMPSISQYYNHNYQSFTIKSRLKTARSGDSSIGRTSSDANVKYVDSTKRQHHLVTGPVVIYNVFRLLAVDKHLASTYVFDNDAVAMCKKNGEVAASLNRTDLVQTWNLAMLCSEQAQKADSRGNESMPWSSRSFGRPLVETLFSHYRAQNDVQTLAMLTCVFGSKPQPAPPLPPPPPTQICAPSTPATTTDAISTEPNFLSVITDSCSSSYSSVSKLRRSCSWSDAFEEPILPGETSEPIEIIKDDNEQEKDSCLPDSMSRQQYDTFKKIYANILYQFGLHKQRAELMKYVDVATNQVEQHYGLDIQPICNKCRKEASHHDRVRCSACNSLTMKCIICHLYVKGLCSVCLLCCHGGHVTHVVDWFLTHTECPTGCGCHCLYQQRTTLVDPQLTVSS